MTAPPFTPTVRRMLRSGFAIRPSFVRTYFLGAAFVSFLMVVWPYESPHWTMTLVAGLTAYTAGFLLIVMAWQRGFVQSVPVWNLAFCGKLTLSYLILIIFWVGPMPSELYRASEGNHLDMIFYDYHAAALATSGWQDAAEHLNFTWLSFGVVAYAALIYTAFGVSILHVALFNSVLALGGILALTAGLNRLSGTQGRWQYMCLALFFPYAAYFDAIISKDVVCNTLFYIGFLLLVRIHSARGKNLVRQYLVLAAIICVIAMVRVNLAMLFLATACTLAFLRGSLLRLAQIVSLGAVAWLAFTVVRPDAAEVIYHILDPGEFFSSQNAFVERVTEEGASPLKVKVAELTIPRSLPSLVLLAPVRLILWLYNPYPEILPIHFSVSGVWEQFRSDPEAFSGSGHVLGAILSSWIICLETPFLIAFFNSRTCRRQPGWIILALLILIPSLIIANVSYVGGKRYRLLIEPLLFAATLWAAAYGRPARYIFPTYTLILITLIIYVGVTFFR